MYRRHGNKLAYVFAACDLAVTAVAWLGAYGLRFACWPSPHGVPHLAKVTDDLPFVLLLAMIAYRFCGLYEIHRLRQLPRELGTIVRAAGLLFLLSITATFYRRDDYESRLALALFLGANVVLLAASRRALWWWLKRLRGRGLNYGRALIVGSGRTGRLVAEAIRRHAWTGLEVVGFVDRARRDASDEGWLGRLDQIAQVIGAHDVDHVFVALPLARYGELPQVYRALDGLLVDVQLVPQIPHLAGVRLQALEIDQLSFLSLRQDPNDLWHRLAKRAVDLAGGAVALACFAPLMALLAAAIKLTDGGPVFYRQQRIGQGGRSFSLLKFRSMRVDAELRSGPVWAVRDDDRCTTVGRLMRRWSLDELPNLFNVLAGDMSLVGPRPERDTFIAQFAAQLPSYVQRHRVKAGMTGWAQVNGWRGNTSVRRRLEFDLYYVANWSLGLDVKILWLTLWRGFRHRHAY
ncbi:MAG: undecaprenyl-phosphate glucose phosphotransferase [Pirellulales bacterium]|nr:undecaprenyl-phosphate glucose phosphotransferase [Pirellulales bacterium]